MAEEKKDETVNEETKDEKLESAGEVTTSPTNDTSNNNEKFTQLEQRITSLEQRFNGQEQQQQQQQQQEQQTTSQQDNSSNEQSDDDSSGEDNGMESNDEIKKILGL